jgi:hypothetical protein
LKFQWPCLQAGNGFSMIGIYKTAATDEISRRLDFNKLPSCQHMKIICLFFVLCPFIVFGQNPYDASLIDTALLKNANAVVRKERVVFEVKSPGEAAMSATQAVTLLNERSGHNKLTLHYSSFNKIKKIKGRIFDAAGNLVREVEKGEIKDLSAISDFSIYEDSRVRQVEIAHSEYPYTVEFEYEINYKGLFSYPGWFPQEFNTSVELSEHVVSLPEGMKVYYKAMNINAEPQVVVADGKQYYKWSARHLAAVQNEAYAPPAGELLPLVLISPGSFEIENFTGSMASWKDFGLFMNKLAEGRDALSPAMKAKVAELTAGAASEREKIEKLYRYLQDNMRYVSVQLGIGGWQPFDAAYVEANRYGDCKALSNFMKAMLKEAGIKAWPVLIHSGEANFDISEDFVSNSFNHMILHVPSENCWLECTDNSAPVNYLGASCADRNVLLVTEEGGTLARTPNPSTAGNFKGSKIAVELQASGEASVRVDAVRKGSLQEWHRFAVRYYSAEDFRKKFQENSSLPGFSLGELKVDIDKHSPTATVAYTAQVPRYASKAGKRLFVPLSTVIAARGTPPANEQRLHPVVVREAFSETDEITITIPDGYQVETMPSEPFSLATPYGTYLLKLSELDGLIKVVRNLEIMPVRCPAAEYNAWRDFHKEVAKADGLKLVLVEKKT